MINSAPFHPLIPQVIREFRRRYPDVAFSLEERTTPGLVAAVRGAAVDVAFVRPIHGSDDGLSIETVIDEAMLVVLSSGIPLAHRVGKNRKGAWRERVWKDRGLSGVAGYI